MIKNGVGRLMKKHSIYKISAITLLSSALIACGGNDKDDNKSSNATGKMPTDTQHFNCQKEAVEIASLNAQSDKASYSITFVAEWDAARFPTNFPSNPHFSPLVGATHNDQIVFWRNEGSATAGIESMAETGNKSAFKSEINTAINNSNAKEIIEASGAFNSPGSACVEGEASTTYPLLTLTSMIAPSPDWFVGVNSLSLRENNEWINTKKVDLRLYDAGTDGGERFTSGNDNNGREDVISQLTTPASDTDFENGINRSSGKYVGYFMIQRIK